MGQTGAPKTIQNEDFWKNPWDVGGLIVIGLFISTLLFFIIFAFMFGSVQKAAWRKAVCEEE